MRSQALNTFLELWTVGQYFTSWRTCVKLAWQVLRQSLTYLVDHLLCSDLTSVRSDIFARYIKFVRGLKASPSMEVSVMSGVVAGDINATTGQNLNVIWWETGLDPLTASLFKMKAAIGSRLAEVLGEDIWRLQYLCKLLEARG